MKKKVKKKKVIQNKESYKSESNINLNDMEEVKDNKNENIMMI